MAKHITSVTLSPDALDVITKAADLERRSRSQFMELASVAAAHKTIASDVTRQLLESQSEGEGE